MSRHLVIVTSNAWPAIFPDEGSTIGGLETFAWNFARHAARSGDLQLDVSILVRTSRSRRPGEVDEVSLLPVHEPLRDVRQNVALHTTRIDRFPGLRIDTWKPGLLWQIPLLFAARLCTRYPPDVRLVRENLLTSGADVVMALGVNEESACVVSTAEAMGLPCVLWLQSNSDLDERFFEVDDFVNPYAVTSQHARSALKSATTVVCQTAWQRDRLKNLAGRDGHVIVNPIDSALWSAEAGNRSNRDHVLWIGRFDQLHKRPHLCVEVARRLPDIPFVMVASGGSADIEHEIRDNLPPNVRLLDHVPHDQMPSRFRQARLFLCTGSHEYEGFPNVLLESAAAGVPVVTLSDFDEFVSASGIGRCADESVEQAAEQVDSLWSDADAWKVASDAGRRYVTERHSFPAIIDQFRALPSIRDSPPVTGTGS